MSSFLKECLKMASGRSFYNLYNRYFDVIEAKSPLEKEMCYRLRYNVFCEENAMNFYTDTPDGLEVDAYDEKARHFMLIHRPSGNIAGTVRVIPPSTENALFSLPLQEVCDHPVLFNEHVAPDLIEFSRLCMNRMYRQRPEDGSILPAYSDHDLGDSEDIRENLTYLRRKIPYAPIGLLQVCVRACLEAQSLNVVMALTKEDCKSLQALGCSYRVLGPALTYYGGLQPIIFNVKHFLDSMKRENRACWEIVSDRGHLHNRANELALNKWHDLVFEGKIRDEILEQVL